MYPAPDEHEDFKQTLRDAVAPLHGKLANIDALVSALNRWVEENISDDMSSICYHLRELSEEFYGPNEAGGINTFLLLVRLVNAEAISPDGISLKDGRFSYPDRFLVLENG